MVCHVSGLLRDVEQREQEDPDDVHEVPIDPDQLDAVELDVLPGVVCDDRHDDRAGDHVEGVEARRGVVERPEGVGRDGVAVRDLVPPLVGLHTDEGQGPEDGEPEEPGCALPVSPLGGLVGQHGREAGGEKHKGVERADGGIGVDGSVSPLGVAEAVHDVGAQQASEDHYLGRQHPPDGELSGLDSCRASRRGDWLHESSLRQEGSVANSLLLDRDGCTRTGPCRRWGALREASFREAAAIRLSTPVSWPSTGSWVPSHRIATW